MTFLLSSTSCLLKLPIMLTSRAFCSSCFDCMSITVTVTAFVTLLSSLFSDILKIICWKQYFGYRQIREKALNTNFVDSWDGIQACWLLRFKRPRRAEFPGWGKWGCYGRGSALTGDTGKQSFPITRKPKKVDNNVNKGIAKLNQNN